MNLNNIFDAADIRNIIKDLKSQFSSDEIEMGLIKSFIDMSNIKANLLENTMFSDIITYQNEELLNQIAQKLNFIDLEVLTDCFEAMLDNDVKNEHGIVFTPMYIVEYITRNSLELYLLSNENESINTLSVLDPACGTGIFLLGALKLLNSKFGISMRSCIEKNLYGIDLQEKNVERCKYVLALACLLNGENIDSISFNIKSCDSLKVNWHEIMGLSKVSLIVGNPPYVNTHDIDKSYVSFLKNNFETTKSGVFNIFYAFVEKALQSIGQKGIVGFVIPNNFLSIKSAEKLRAFIQKDNYMSKVIDFGSNMIFKPTRTYNCIVFFDKTQKSHFEYSVMQSSSNIQNDINYLNFHLMDYDRLDKKGWNLVADNVHDNITKIEGQFISIKNFIRTGIATLKDDIFFIDSKNNGDYCKYANGNVFRIEQEIVKPIYKISDISDSDNLHKYKRHIIFPYKKCNDRFEIIKLNDLEINYPNTLNYLTEVKETLNSRDKGKINSVAWYAYGRTQGLNKYGSKLLFPTFSKKPKFMLEKDETALFCNGYAVFENDFIELEILQKVLNSVIMEYYINNTSYSIEGGYMCYQKKYIEKFSLPLFSVHELDYLKKENNSKKINEFLIWKYQLSL